MNEASCSCSLITRTSSHLCVVPILSLLRLKKRSNQSRSLVSVGYLMLLLNLTKPKAVMDEDSEYEDMITDIETTILNNLYRPHRLFVPGISRMSFSCCVHV